MGGEGWALGALVAAAVFGAVMARYVSVKATRGGGGGGAGGGAGGGGGGGVAIELGTLHGNLSRLSRPGGQRKQYTVIPDVPPTSAGKGSQGVVMGVPASKSVNIQI